jgi:hypothetical protein
MVGNSRKRCLRIQPFAFPVGVNGYKDNWNDIFGKKKKR